MNKLIHTALPSGVLRWLSASLAWTAVCLLPCAAFWYWAMEVKDANCRSCGTTALLTPLAIVVVLGSKVFLARAFAGSNSLFEQARWRDWTTVVAFGWLLVLRIILMAWLLLDLGIVILMLFSWLDDGKSWSV
ncbi:hypothetical protein [Hymenobacter negativus]|uniref:DUF2752 domain-containing protein n=1 Tax=Hymenobacter negativus TaxID=2795026 RepID=A0ABS0Q771_9BACT|nr:hypothetical protein [Hymenobacter negativus]MBH8558213.1 hypothetical protein [Hymenobacter negativus]